MKIIEFSEQTVVIAKGQPQYIPMPAYRLPNDPKGRIVCCWELSWLERLRVLFSGLIWHQILTFDAPLQPQLLTVTKPEMGNGVKPIAFVEREEPSK